MLKSHIFSIRFIYSIHVIKKRLGHAQIGLLKSSDQHPRPIHMGVPPGPSAVQGPKFNRQPSKKIFFTVSRQKYRQILTVKKFQGITNLTISADLYGDSCPWKKSLNSKKNVPCFSKKLFLEIMNVFGNFISERPRKPPKHNSSY